MKGTTVTTINPRRGRTIACIAGVLWAGCFVSNGTAHAADVPAAGCGKAWTLVTIDQAVQFVYDATASVQPYRDAEWFSATSATFDAYDAANNDDGYLCAKTTGSTPGQDKQVCARLGYEVCRDYTVTNINDNSTVGQLNV
jgi:hypothetical protein